jgi:hypothetical protein
VIAETRRLSAIELGIRPGFGDHKRNKAPGGFRKQSRIWHKISQIIRFRRSKSRRPPASGISLKKAAPPAPFGDCFFYNHVLPL